MPLLKVAILLAATLAVTCAHPGDVLKPTPAIQAMAKKAFWDPEANEQSRKDGTPLVPPYSFCGGKLAGGDIIVKSYNEMPTSVGSGTTYFLKVDFRFPASGSSKEFYRRDQVVGIRKGPGANGKLSVISNPCG